MSFFHIQESDSESDGEIYAYPQETFKYKKPTEEHLGPYGSQWIHERQKNDKIDETAKNNTNIVRQLLKLKFYPQKSKGWHRLRKERITASDGGTSIGFNKHEPQYGFLIKKIRGIPFVPSKPCHHGNKYEQTATMIYEYRKNVKVEEFGLIGHPKYDFLAASPDGIVYKYKLDGKSLTKHVGTMLEIKCPITRQIQDTGDIKGTICPIYYWIQVQLQLECCNLNECDFWQCKILEYEDKEDFIKDTDLDEPFRSKSTGMEKGCVIQLLPKSKIEDIKKGKYLDVLYGDSKYIYPPRINMSPYDCDMWIASVMDDLPKAINDQNIKCDDCMEKCEDCECIYKKCNCSNDMKKNVECNCYYFDRIIYWKVAKTKNVTIERDRKWFADTLPLLKKMWNYVLFFRNNEDISNIFFDYLESLSFKDNDEIMKIVEYIYNKPDENNKKELNKYNKFLDKLKNETELNKKKHEESDEDD